MQNEISIQNQPFAGMVKQFLAMFYDAWLLAAVLLIASALTLPFTGSDPRQPNYDHIYTVGMVWLFSFFWTRGGQTLGMRAWQIQLVTDEGKALNL